MNYKSKETLGIIFAIIAYFSFSILDAIQKSAVLYYSIFQLLFIKYIFVLLLSILEARRNKNITFDISEITGSNREVFLGKIYNPIK